MAHMTRKQQHAGQQIEDEDNCIGNRRNPEIEHEMAAVHLGRTVENLAEAGRTEFCAHAATLAIGVPFSSRLPGSQADRTTRPQIFAMIKARSAVTRLA